MPEIVKCPQCGTALPTGALAGLCPACLLQQGAAADTATRPAPPPFEPPPLAELARLFPQLEILSLLGKGGMGAVYKARQRELDRYVALKILPAQAASGAGFEERFNREARALARLSHPNIVAVHEFGQVSGLGAGVPSANAGQTSSPSVPATGSAAETVAGGTPVPRLHYFIMEFVDGANLRQLEQAGRLSPREALQIVPQICDALQYAHDESVVHRDIKPENVLVDRKGRVKIADFGLAKILNREPQDLRLTGEGQVMGTPHYMAPEQVEHPLQVDHRADIYSLGVVFYELLTGELPLGKFPPPSRKVQVDVRLDDVVLHALEKEPERRYQQASQVKTDVETIATTSKPAGQPPLIATPQTMNPWQPAILLVGVVVGLALLLVGMMGPQPANWLAFLFGSFTLVVSVLKLAGLWPFPSGLFPQSNFTGRNLRRGPGAAAIAARPGPTLWTGWRRLWPPVVVRRGGARVINWPAVGVRAFRGVLLMLLVAFANAVVLARFEGPKVAVVVGVGLAIGLLLLVAFILVARILHGFAIPLETLPELNAAVADTVPLTAAPAAEDIRRQVQRPAVGLLVTGILNWILIPLAMLLLLPYAAADAKSSGVPQLAVLVFALTPLVLCSVVIFAAVRMMHLESRGLAIAASVLAAIVTPGNLVGLPVGIWSLAVLTRREVRAAFRSNAAAKPLSKGAKWLWLLGAAAVIVALALALFPWSGQPEMKVAGRVTDAVTGKPIAGARVADNHYGTGARRTPLEAWTDTNGQYALLTWAEEHNITASAPGYGIQLATLTTSLLERERQTRMDFQLPPAWGPVHEFTFERFSPPVDLDTGRLIEPPPQPFRKERDSSLWLAHSGGDIGVGGIGSRKGLITSLSNEVKLVRLTNLVWAGVTARDLNQALLAGASGLEENLDAKDLWKGFLLPTNGQSPLVFAFRTAPGAMGLLELTSIQNQRGSDRSVSLRFKTLGPSSLMKSEPSSRPDPPAVQEAKAGPATAAATTPAVPPTREPQEKAAATTSGSAFGVVIERVLYDQKHRVGSCLDLDSGRLVTTPANSQSADYRWMRTNDIDVMCDTTESIRGLLATGGVIVQPVEADRWDAMTPGEVSEALMHYAPDPAAVPVAMTGNGELPRTYLFRTLANGLGLLQITGFVDNPPGVRIRYKLVQPTATAARPVAASASAIPLIEMRDVPLLDAIKALAKQAQVNYVLDPKVEAGVTGPDGRPIPRSIVSVRWENVTAQTALTKLLENYSLQLLDDPKSGIARITVQAAASVESWSPQLRTGEKPDPAKVHTEARDLTAQGRYEEALQRCLWFHQHALEFDPALSAVRLSYALADWMELARRYPKAKQALVEIRDRKTRAIAEGRGSLDLFHDVAAINQHLQEEDATLALMKTLHEKAPALAKQCYFYAEELLVKKGEYALCLSLFPDFQARFDLIRQGLAADQKIAQENPQMARPEFRKSSDNRFADQTCRLIEILVATGHKAEAQKTRDQAIALSENPRLKSAVSDAEKKTGR
ncbi:MAG: protein kinase [Verrucomicrobia bacterium]|nr:protein kinase [Verrucomicrobiota bacterium]